MESSNCLFSSSSLSSCSSSFSSSSFSFSFSFPFSSFLFSLFLFPFSFSLSYFLFYKFIDVKNGNCTLLTWDLIINSSRGNKVHFWNESLFLKWKHGCRVYKTFKKVIKRTIPWDIYKAFCLSLGWTISEI